MNIPLDEHPQQYLILGLLLMKEQHGYDLHQHLSSTMGRAWYTGKSHMYALLTRLEASGYILSRTKRQEPKPPRKIYRITPEGRRVFEQWVSTPVQRIRDLRLEFLTKLFFIRNLGLFNTDNLLSAQADLCTERLETLKTQLARTEDPFDRLVYDFRISQIVAVIHWLRNPPRHVSENDQTPSL